MWQGPSEDPGGPDGGSKEPPSTKELKDLKDQFENQQVLIAQLKEMLRKTDQPAVTPEKVAEYANTLTKMQARAKRFQQKEGGRETVIKKVSETASSHKIQLIKQQMEENKMKLAERGKSQRGVEEMVLQIKAQLDDSQQLISQTPLNISLIEDRVEYSPSNTSQELYNILLNKDKRISEMHSKISKLEANIMDLQENVKEKDSVIDARTKAITLMSENLSKKGKNTLDALDETKEQMRKMQENFIKMEEEMKVDKCRLLKELEEKISENEELRLSLSTCNIEFENFKRGSEEELKEKMVEIEELKVKLNNNLESSRNSPARSSKKNKRGKSKQSNIQDSSPDRLSQLEKLIKEQENTIETYSKELEKLQGELKIKTEEYENIILKLKSEITALKHSDADFNVENPEVAKLKKQLDESNKNMIKVKAQHKSKIKELNKKLDGFKKLGDLNAEVVRLDSENSKLTQKIAELEEEKGQMQLNMVESKDSIITEDFKYLENKVDEHQATISAKEDIISGLEKQLEENKLELSKMAEKLENLSGDQIKSDLTSIQFEEQLDKLEAEKKEILEEKEKANMELLEKIEGLTKEKQEIGNKLETYMAENMELMDRLEKLSGEKVSSAESIEIVENLTQQEKLELEAYQKSLVHKSAENLEENPELNDSVSQLTEETSELLQKIELFTVERREVMEKMELLTNENNQLSFKLKEIENNRDVLAETYEQLQTEKEELDCKLEKMEDLLNKSNNAEVDEYKKLIEIQREEIKDLKIKIMSHQSHDAVDSNLKEKVVTLENQYTDLLKENETLRSESEKFEVNSELTKRITEFEAKIKDHLEEIENYKTILEENKVELISSANMINDLQSKLQEKSAEIEHYQNEVAHLNSVIEDLNGAISKLEEENQANTEKNVELMSMQLEELKLALNENLEQTKEYDRELEEKTEATRKLNTEIKEMSNKVLETQEILDSKDEEIKRLKSERLYFEEKNKELETELEDKKEGFHKVCEELKLKCVSLQEQIAQNAGSFGPLEGKVKQLEEKNKAQLEKMKKIAANLKKKTLDYNDLDAKHKDVNEKWEHEKNEKEGLIEKLEENEKKLLATVVQLQEVESEVGRLQRDTEEKNNDIARLNEENLSINNKNAEFLLQIQNVSAQLEDSQNIVREYETQMNSLRNEVEMLRSNSNNALNSELSQKEETIAALTEQLDNLRYNSEANSNALQMKINELEMYIESQESEINNHKERTSRLEEGLSKVEERRLSLERKAIQLGSELEAKESSYEEASQNGEDLERRLMALVEKDEIFEARIKELMNENQELLQSNDCLKTEVDTLNKKLEVLNGKLKQSGDSAEELSRVIEDNLKLNGLIMGLESEIGRLQRELGNVKEETEKGESELQEQLEIFGKERKALMEQCEVGRDEIIRLKEEIEDLKAEVQDLNGKLDQQQVDFEENIQKHVALESEYKIVLSEVEKKTDEVDKLKNCLNDKENEFNNLEQILLEKENVLARLLENEQNMKESLTKKEIEIEALKKAAEEKALSNIGQPISQTVNVSTFLQEENVYNMNQSNAVPDFFKWPGANNEPTIDNPQINLQETLNNKQLEIESMNRVLKEKNLEIEKLQKELVESRKKLERMNEQSSQISQSNTASNLFNFPTASNDPFDFVTETPVLSSTLGGAQVISSEVQSTSSSENSNEELLQKIKTLEFMLFNVEKEKDNALLQCHELSNELTTLIYERENKGNLTNLESQILEGGEISITPEVRERILFQEVKPCIESMGEPVEEVCVSRTAYICHPENPNVDTFAENDDGWGWGPDETKLEQEHFQQVESEPRNLKQHIHELEEKVKVLEMQRENTLEELKQSQIKSGKLIKKLKEFKAKNEQLTLKLKDAGFGDLNDAIQEELKSQVESLEKKIKEIKLELDKEKAEKELILKRVDVLTSANERMIEMKEKQDIEVFAWQQRNKELNSKLEKLEWGDDNFEEKPKKVMEETGEGSQELLRKIEDLNEVVKDLTLDNEELQSMLEEQRNLRMAADKAKSIEPIPENMKTEAEYNALLNEIISLKDEMIKLREESEDLRRQNENKNELNREFEATKEKIKEIHQQLQINYAEKTQLEATILENNIIIEDLMQKLKEGQDSLETFRVREESASEMKVKMDELENEKRDLSTQNEQFVLNLNQYKTALENLEGEKLVILKDLEEVKVRCGELDIEKNELLKNKDKLVSEGALVNDLRDQVEVLSSERNNLLLEIDNFKENIRKLVEEKVGLEEQLRIYQAKDNEAKALMDQLQEKDLELTNLRETLIVKDKEFEVKLNSTVEQLIIEWSQHVEQRGSDVAESWKLHVDTRENEFVQIEQNLKRQISDLEEKYNAIVNENNELRKNVDAEIRTEIDRYSTLQHQISEKQTQINELSRLAQERSNELEKLHVQNTKYTSIIQQLNINVEEADRKLKVVEDLLEEKENVSRELEKKVNVFQEKLVESENEILRLKTEIETKVLLIVEKDKDLEERKKAVDERDVELEKLRSNVAVAEAQNENEAIIKELRIELKEKENEIRENQLYLEDYQKQLQQYNVQLSGLNSAVEEKEFKINELAMQLQQYQNETSNMENIQHANYELQQQVNNCNIQLQENNVYVQNLTQELENYKMLSEQIQIKDSEINQLKSLMEENRRDFEYNLESKSLESLGSIQEKAQEIENLKHRLMDTEIKFEEYQAAKDVEIDSYKQQMAEVFGLSKEEKVEIERLREELVVRDRTCLELEGKLVAVEKELVDLRSIIEEQVLKIEELKKDLFEKSSNYDELVAELRPESLEVSRARKELTFEKEDVTDPVNRAELDLALYMLHQRDVRCEELTVELMQLLEERDTLQLRLSNAIREKEELRRKPEGEAEIAKQKVESVAGGAVPKSRAIVLGASGTEMAAEAMENLPDGSLENKLSELKTVGYRKDKTILDEQDMRRIQQLSILQQHKDEVAKLPAEAAARLVDASYTLSRDVQSPSKVILNWLWGKSTPKVNNV